MGDGTGILDGISRLVFYTYESVSIFSDLCFVQKSGLDIENLNSNKTFNYSSLGNTTDTKIGIEFSFSVSNISSLSRISETSV